MQECMRKFFIRAFSHKDISSFSTLKTWHFNVALIWISLSNSKVDYVYIFSLVTCNFLL